MYKLCSAIAKFGSRLGPGTLGPNDCATSHEPDEKCQLSCDLSCRERGRVERLNTLPLCRPGNYQDVVLCARKRNKPE
jgi:hypothetical protein